MHKIFTDQLRNIKYFKYLSLPYRPNISMLQLFDGSSIWNRYTIQSGLIDIFGYAIDWGFGIVAIFLISSIMIIVSAVLPMVYKHE